MCSPLWWLMMIVVRERALITFPARGAARQRCTADAESRLLVVAEQEIPGPRISPQPAWSAAECGAISPVTFPRIALRCIRATERTLVALRAGPAAFVVDVAELRRKVLPLQPVDDFVRADGEAHRRP